jgi:hypothetical protein
MNLRNYQITKEGMREPTHECIAIDKYIILNLQNIAGNI